MGKWVRDCEGVLDRKGAAERAALAEKLRLARCFRRYVWLNRWRAFVHDRRVLRSMLRRTQR